jgi:hypothetical protein
MVQMQPYPLGTAASFPTEGAHLVMSTVAPSTSETLRAAGWGKESLVGKQWSW